MQVRSFGHADGVEIHEVGLRNAAGATASVITWGAVLRDLVVPSGFGLQRVVLGLNTIEDYRTSSPYFGATPGRFANRIAGASFVLDGRTTPCPPTRGRAPRCTAARTASARCPGAWSGPRKPASR